MMVREWFESDDAGSP
ncbi:Protein of unknown function [Thermobacillus xylanilyticus]|uniref:Uncharacterized protein n=1 Tax=Thermobacillus xylanilyticus TaxID=76633 RepID=A0ABN7RSU6_THEXY|nr:Protein of unknown function [Thermobacillus xylanilyticus]